MGYYAKILKDSIATNGKRLTTMEVSYPRIVLAEFNTHRVLSRNSASSRAIPVKRMLKRVKEDPFIPIYWGRNQSGMQAAEQLTADEAVEATKRWLVARDRAIESVESLAFKKEDGGLDVHKQIANRILEPWLYHTVIVTATEWDNYFALRCHKDAQPEIRKVALMMQELYEAHEPEQLEDGQWHLPLIGLEGDEKIWEEFSLEDIIKISVGRCTRVSYLTHDGLRDPNADLTLHDRILSAGHMSPFEHVARPAVAEDTNWVAHHDDLSDTGQVLPESMLFGNIRGWVQYRKTLPGEAVFGSGR